MRLHCTGGTANTGQFKCQAGVRFGFRQWCSGWGVTPGRLSGGRGRIRQAGRGNCRKNHPGINFYNLGVQDDASPVLATEGEAFDAVVSTEVVEHLFSPHLLPAFARQIMLEGGYLVISTPYHGYLKNLALSVFNKWDKHHTPLWHGGHIKFWSRKTLTQLLEENGFRVTAFHGAGRLPWLWKSMILVAQAV